MAHFAQLENGVVTQVIVVNNQEIVENGVESETKGIEFCQNLFPGTTWKQTFYTAATRKHFAAVGYYYDSELDSFIPPKPFPSWLLNTETCTWYSPVPYPENTEVLLVWNEENQGWLPV